MYYDANSNTLVEGVKFESAEIESLVRKHRGYCGSEMVDHVICRGQIMACPEEMHNIDKIGDDIYIYTFSTGYRSDFICITAENRMCRVQFNGIDIYVDGHLRNQNFFASPTWVEKKNAA